MLLTGAPVGNKLAAQNSMHQQNPSGLVLAKPPVPLRHFAARSAADTCKVEHIAAICVAPSEGGDIAGPTLSSTTRLSDLSLTRLQQQADEKSKDTSDMEEKAST